MPNFGRLIAAGAAGVLALLLLSSGVPRLLAALASLPGDAPLARVLDRNPVSPEQLARVVESRGRSLAWVDEGRRYTEQALARLMLAEEKPVLDAGADLGPVRDALIEGLARAPASPYAWARLAYVEDLQRGATARAVAFARMSVLTGPYEDRLLLRRLDIALRGWDSVSPADAALFLDQIRRAWRRAPEQLQALAHSTERPDLVSQALADHPDAAASLKDPAPSRR